MLTLQIYEVEPETIYKTRRRELRVVHSEEPQTPIMVRETEDKGADIELILRVDGVEQHHRFNVVSGDA